MPGRLRAHRSRNAPNAPPHAARATAPHTEANRCTAASGRQAPAVALEPDAVPDVRRRERTAPARCQRHGRPRRRLRRCAAGPSTQPPARPAVPPPAPEPSVGPPSRSAPRHRRPSARPRPGTSRPPSRQPPVHPQPRTPQPPSARQAASPPLQERSKRSTPRRAGYRSTHRSQRLHSCQRPQARPAGRPRQARRCRARPDDPGPCHPGRQPHRHSAVTATEVRPDQVTVEFEDRCADLHRAAYQAGFRLLGDRAAAEDIAQEAVARCLVRWTRVADHAVPWVVRVATNLGIDEARRRQRHRQPVEQTAPLIDLDRRQDLVRVLARLPRRQREVVALRYLADLDDSSVARALGLSLGSVKQHAARGLAALRRDPSMMEMINDV
jgi:RNA polymerase sigma factor (sigma-70 family)